MQSTQEKNLPLQVLLFDPEQDELSDSYSKAIKMYLVFGLERTLEILSGKYSINKTFLDNVSKLNVSKIEMKPEGKKYLPVFPFCTT